MRLLASEIDAIFRGERDVQEIHGQAIRHGLRERALRLGAVLDIDSQPGPGTAVRLTMPYAPPARR